MISILVLNIIIQLLVVKSSESLNSYIYLPDKYIQEEISIGSLIADLSEELDKQHDSLNKLKISNDQDSSENQHFTFLEDTKSSTENTYYLIDSVTGRITSKRYLDRESMCMNKHCMEACDSTTDSKSNCKMNLKVLLIPSYDIVSLNIIVQDLNDNKPQFRIDLINQSIPENVPIGYKIPIDLAYDPDSGVNSIQYYSLSSSSPTVLIKDTFQLVQTTNELSLIVNQKLDREKVAQYNLSINACDGGAPSNCGQLRIILNIIDINDHNPIFLKEIYSFKVNENLQAGNVIGKVSAYDLDEGINGQIKYSLIGFNGYNQDKDTQLSNFFNLDENTGVLTLNNKLLDFEAEQQFSLTVEAKDCGVGSLPAYATIEILVQDENDNSPEISISFFNSLQRNFSINSSIQTIYMKENYEPNKFIALVSIVDRDSAENARLDWKIYVNNQDVKLSTVTEQFLSINTLNSNSFTINTGPKADVLFDREKIACLNVSVVSWDFGEKPNTATYNFQIVFLDVNDNAPMFDKPEYELNIFENNEMDKFIYKFNATDLDLNENGQIAYMLELGEESKFITIEETTGILRASKIFDRELKDTYSFFVIARDSSIDLNKRLWSKVKCTLNVLDLNDNSPIITFNQSSLPYKEFSNKTALILRLDENMPLNTQLVKFNCSDSDSNGNGRTKLFLFNRNQIDLKENDYLPFKLSDDGRLLVAKKLDRETLDFYDMQLVCFDQPINKIERLNTSINLIIRLSDVNDNCPRSINNSLNNYDYLDETTKTKFIIRNLKEFNKSISLFSANYTDYDIGKNAELKFQLQTHTDLFKLKIEEQKLLPQSIYSVKIQLRNATDLFKLGKYIIKLKISDNGYPTCIKTDSFVLYVGDNKEIKTQSILVEMLKSLYNRKISDEEALKIDLVNDQEEENYDLDESIKDDEITDETVLSKSIQPALGVNKSFLSLFKSSQFIVLFVLIATLVLIAAMLSSIGLVYCFKKRIINKKLTIDMLKVKNYRDNDLNDSNHLNSNSTSPSTEEENLRTEDDDEDSRPTETNTLLDTHDKNINRYSMSTDKSNSASSVVSNITYVQRDNASHSSNEITHNIRSHYSNQIYINSKRNSTFVTNNQYKPGYEQHIKTSSSFLSSSSSSSITPPYSTYKPANAADNNDLNSSNKLEIRKFLGDNGTLPNYVRLNRNYQHQQQQQQYQRNIIEENTNTRLMKSFPYNQLAKTEPRFIKKQLTPPSNLNDSTSSTSSSQMVTHSDCSEIVIVPTTTSTLTSTSPSSISSASSSSSSTQNDSEIKYNKFNLDNEQETKNRTHFLRSSAV